MNVLVVLLESMRAFEMGLYGAKDSFTPNLDAFGQRALRVDFKANYNPFDQREASSLTPRQTRSAERDQKRLPRHQQEAKPRKK
jgi:hypothetical protein